MSGLAKKHRLYVAAGTIPSNGDDGALHNECFFFGPSGAHTSQFKIHMTRFEKEEWMVQARNDRHSASLSPEAYVREVVSGRLTDATLTFQLNRGFKVLAVVASYMRHDPLSLGYAAVIEYLNPETATAEDWERQRASPYYA
jgi:hypothetical protein